MNNLARWCRAVLGAVLAAHALHGSPAVETRAAQTPVPRAAANPCVSSDTLNYRVSPLKKESIAISQIPIKTSRGLACFIISSSLKPFRDMECEK